MDALLRQIRIPSPGAAGAGQLCVIRAGLLVHLATLASSTELAARFGATTTAVNQHLRTLHAAGLLVSARHGRSGRYRRCDLGDQLAGRPRSGRRRVRRWCSCRR